MTKYILHQHVTKAEYISLYGAQIRSKSKQQYSLENLQKPEKAHLVCFSVFRGFQELPKTVSSSLSFSALSTCSTI